jgi:hypothetical protein
MAVFQLGPQRHFTAPSAAKCSPPFFWSALGRQGAGSGDFLSRLNRWGQFTATPGPGLLTELQVFNRKSAPAAITEARGQEPSGFRSVIRRLRGEAKKPR